MSTSPNTKKQKVDLRLPHGMREAVTNYGVKEGRSMNAQIVHFIELGLSGIDAATMARAVLDIQHAIAEIKRGTNIK